MKILVLGQNGMLGHVVYHYFKEKNHEVIGTNTQNGPIIYNAYTNQEDLEKIVETEKPDVVINCIGILNNVAEENKTLATKLNSLLPHYIDELSQKYNFKFIHVSTDCVFDGEKGKYNEDSFPTALSFYGRSKALGEVKNKRSVTLRTSIVGPDFNPKGIGLFQWFMNQEGTINGYQKVIWTGVTTIQLAKCMEIAIEKNLCGLQHVVNNQEISKYDLLRIFKKVFGKNIEIEKETKTVSKKTLVRTEKSYDFDIPSYETMVEDMRDWVQNHKDLYKNIELK